MLNLSLRNQGDAYKLPKGTKTITGAEEDAAQDKQTKEINK